MKNRRISAMVFIYFFLLSIVIVLIGLMGYGAVQFFTYQERKDLSQFKSDQIGSLQETIECLTAEVYMLKEYTRWETVSFHKFSPQEVAELDALEEMLRQKIYKYYRSKLTGKDGEE